MDMDDIRVSEEAVDDGDYLVDHSLLAYLEDAVTQFLTLRAENQSNKIKPSKFLKEYFCSVHQGTHVLFREFAFISATTYNRCCVVKAIMQIFKPLLYREENLNMKDYHSLLQLIWPDIPYEIVQVAFVKAERHQQMKTSRQDEDLRYAQIKEEFRLLHQKEELRTSQLKDEARSLQPKDEMRGSLQKEEGRLSQQKEDLSQQKEEVRLSFLDFVFGMKFSFCIGEFDHEANIINAQLIEKMDEFKRIIRKGEKCGANFSEADFLCSLEESGSDQASLWSLTSGLVSNSDFRRILNLKESNSFSSDEPVEGVCGKLSRSSSGSKDASKSDQNVSVFSRATSASLRGRLSGKQLSNSLNLLQTEKLDSENNFSSRRHRSKSAVAIQRSYPPSRS